LTTTFGAADGPLFVTLRVYVKVCPAVTGSGASLLVRPRSADPRKLTDPVA
jgi:hypothetical protein